jgi:hypothetical protein
MPSSTMRAIARRRAEVRMTDMCVVSREVRSSRPDPATAKHTVTLVPVYWGICEYVAANTAARETEQQGRQRVEQGAQLRIPVDAPGSAECGEGMVATVLLSTHDAGSAPLEVQVTAGHHQTFAVSRRLPVKEVSGD